MDKFVIEFKGKKSFDTYEKTEEFRKERGDKYICTIKCTYPDAEFYIVEFDED